MNGNPCKLAEKFLEGNASATEKKQLLNELDNPESFNSWLSDCWNQADTEDLDARVEKKMYMSIQHQKRKISPVVRLNFWRAASVVLLLLSTAMTALWFNQSTEILAENNDQIISVDKGQKATITLPDGSKVWLNSDTKISYGSDYNHKKRIVYLSGEAYFDVAHKKDVPFIVCTKEMSVKALGTIFNVKAYEDDLVFSTILLKGSVEVEADNKKCILLPDQRIILNRSNKTMELSQLSNAIEYLAWKENKFVFENESFESIASILSRQYNVVFHFENEDLKRYRFSGTVHNTGLESLLELFSLTSPLSYQIQDSTIIFRENKKLKKYYDKNIN